MIKINDKGKKIKNKKLKSKEKKAEKEETDRTASHVGRKIKRSS